MRRLTVDDHLLQSPYVINCSTENDLHELSATVAEHSFRRVVLATRSEKHGGIIAVIVSGQQWCCLLYTSDAADE